MNKKLTLAIAVSVVVVIFGYFAFGGLGRSLVYFWTPSELLAEGEREKLEQLLGWCRRGPDLARVADIQAEWEEGTGEFQEFSIRH